MKLLNHSTKYFAGVLILVLSIWTVIFYVQMLDEIYDSLDDGLENQKIAIINKAEKDPSILQKNTFEDGNYTIQPVDFEPIKKIKDHYRDTLMFTKNEEDFEPFRVLETVFKRQDGYYQLKIITSMVEEDDLIEDLLYSILWLYLGLVSSILILNNWVLKKIWHPFYSLIEQLKNYSIEKNQSVFFEPTSIEEFSLLNLNIERLLKKSTDSFREQKQFIENASHELQTPLAIALNKVELLVEHQELTPQQLTLLASVLDNLERMTRLNSALLMLSKIENKQFTEEESLEVNDLIKSITNQFSDLLKHRKLRLNITSEATIHVRMNRDLAVILLTNLIKNAILHAASDTEIQISVLKNNVRIENVSEEAALDHEKLFSRFYKKNISKNSTGLGLAIAKSITDKYGFRLRYEFAHKHIFSIQF